MAERQRLASLSNEARDDSAGEMPGSERGDEETRLFLASLGSEDREFVKGHKGLGNSQKAEVAWLERCGYEYEELDVRDFDFGAVAGRKWSLARAASAGTGGGLGRSSASS